MKPDTFNKFQVSAYRDSIVVMTFPYKPMTKPEALTLAAWLVVMSGTKKEFDEILKAVKNENL
jgi:hypothetical protein